MARFKEKAEAIELRKQGWSYLAINEKLKISKGTLSGWLKDYPLAPERLKELLGLRQHKIERYQETRRKSREASLKEICRLQSEMLFPLSQRDLFVAGLFLYWGEGLKASNNQLALSNTDPAMLRFFINWATKFVHVPRKKLKPLVHLYSDMDIKKEMIFWSKSLNLPLEQFSKPYIKESLSKNITYKNGFGHGTCNLRIFSAKIAQQVLMGIKALQEYYA